MFVSAHLLMRGVAEAITRHECTAARSAVLMLSFHPSIHEEIAMSDHNKDQSEVFYGVKPFYPATIDGEFPALITWFQQTRSANDPFRQLSKLLSIVNEMRETTLNASRTVGQLRGTLPQEDQRKSADLPSPDSNVGVRRYRYELARCQLQVARNNLGTAI